MIVVKDIDMERITDLELQIKSIDLALEVSKTLMRDNQTAYEATQKVAIREIHRIQSEIDAIIEADPTIDDESESDEQE
tara:strand:- start:9434 stop:9670 length:237 start_codon:yes stop_codon:yes gene_type:complete